MFHPATIIVMVATTLCLLVAAIHFYKELSREIDARLKNNLVDNSARIMSSPLKLSVGDRMTIEEVADYLRATGYSDKAGAESSNEGWFAANDKTIEVVPGNRGPTSGQAQPVRIEVNKRGLITSLKSSSGRRLVTASLEGRLLASVKQGDRRKKIEVQFAEIPTDLMNAVLAAEDRRFFDHNGVDWRGIGRALWIDIRRGELAQGGSTITQQLVKNAFLSQERTLDRKLKEAAMALILESRLPKEKIFELYFNEVYLGHSGRFAVHGFAQAAQIYFDRELKDLSIGEFAFLAGLIRAPNRYSARKDMSQAIQRRNQVLDSMASMNAISDDECTAAKNERLLFKSPKTSEEDGASYFIDYAMRFVEDRNGWEGLANEISLTTTLDIRLQQAANEAVKRHTERIDRQYFPKQQGSESGVQAALVAINAHSGEVLAMVGGRSYDQSQLNRATDAMRQPGSAFKPFVYAAALSQRRYTAATLLSDRPQSFTYGFDQAEYRPSNFGGSFSNRDVTLAEALTRSLNVPAVELAQRVGLSTVANLVHDSGLPNPRVYPSMALGASEVTLLDLAAAYTVFANYGTAVRPTPVKSIYWADAGHQQQISSTRVRAINEQVAFLMTDLMASVVNRGTGSRARQMGLRGDVAGKTGTSRDGWFVGYTPNLICAVWVGFDDNRDLRLKGSDSALPIWVDFMLRALEIRPELGGEFRKPPGITSAVVDPGSGLLATSSCSNAIRFHFIAGTEPYASCQHDTLDELSIWDEQSSGEEVDDTLISDSITVEVCSVTSLIPSEECTRVKKRVLRISDFPSSVCNPADH
jgi:penicillin-binding protein 1B